MLNKVGTEMHGVALLSKTRDTLLTLATTARLGVADVVGLSINDLREHLDDLNTAVAGSVSVLELRRFERWAGVLAPAETTRTILQEAMEVEEQGSWEVAGANTGPTASALLKVRCRSLALTEYQHMRTDPAALDGCVAICVQQGLEPAQVVALSASIELGQRVSPNDVRGIGAFKTDPRNLPIVKAVAKYNNNTFTKIVDRSDPRELVAHLTDLARDFASAGDATQAMLVSSFLSEAQVCFMNDAKGLFRYIKNFFRVYPGQGLPVVFDDRMATRARNESRDSTPVLSKEDVKNLMRIELAGELADLRRQVGRGRGGGDPRPTTTPLTGEQAAAKLAKVKCFKCQSKGHFARDCPNEKVEVVDLTE